MSIRDERVARCIGWLEGFSTTIWALVSTNDGAKMVDPSACDEYDSHVRMLREALYDCPVTDTGPFVVRTVPLSTLGKGTCADANAERCDTCEAMLDCDECLRADASHKELRGLRNENEKLRELVDELYPLADYGGYAHELSKAHDLMRELGIEVDE